jgi:hypothetical protein
MKTYRVIRRKMNERFRQAEREGRLEEELAVMAREARAWIAKGRHSRRPRAKPA